MLERLERVRARYEELTRLLSDPAVVSNQDRLREISKEHSDLTPLMRIFDLYAKARKDLAGLKELTETSSDPEMKQLAYAELDEARTRVATLEEELKVLLVP
ncbi:MAG TPA: PCRF domain-containing protein, partial [Bacteroidota bacterium]|nr:PCRF domain-containing protein [Bacteroidota bacterium]